MAHQLIAAKLNILNGADSAVISGTITAADSWLSSHPLGSDPPNPDRQLAIQLAGTLDEFNNINGALITARGNMNTGASYSYTDAVSTSSAGDSGLSANDNSAAEAYSYKLEVVDSQGLGIFLAPATGSSQSIYLPLIVR